MARTVYSLLVGIDAYPDPVPRLSGCVNDVQAIGEMLHGQVAGDGLRLELQTLTDGQATRQAVIDGFRAHLSRAGAERRRALLLQRPRLPGGRPA